MARLKRMRPRAFAAVTATGLALAAAVAVAPAHAGSASLPSGNDFQQTNLVSDQPGHALVFDSNLKNAWGLAMSSGSPIWVSDNNSGNATVYSVTPGGTSAKLDLTVPLTGGRASTGDGPSPTGQVFNGTQGFVVGSGATSGPAPFIFDSESGQISGWTHATGDQIAYSSPTAVYKGLAMATDDAGTFLYASNFHDGTVDVFNSSFQLVTTAGGFKDWSLPAGYAPFGIQNLNGLIYVSYAKQDAAKHDDVAGVGHGFVDVFTTNGFLVERLISHGNLDSPWGMTIAPAGFGRFSGALLVGNFGNGHINAYEPFSGRFLGTLRGAYGQPITIDGLWGLTFGTATTGGTGTLLFSAGPNDEQDGLLGALNPAS